MTKEWIEWDGGKCPVPAGTLVDVKYRGGATEYSLPALENVPSDSGLNARNCFWLHDAHRQDIIAWRLHQPEQAAWNGEGLPPVGTECEREAPGGWSKCKIKYSSEYYVIYSFSGEEKDLVSITGAYKFRPIRTEAERKREEFTDACIDLDSSQDWSHSTDYFRGLYDAIAAGKIPGVKLENEND